MDTAVDGTFNLINISSHADQPSMLRVEVSAACTTDGEMQDCWEFTKGGIPGESGTIIDEIADLEDDLHSNSDFSSEGTVLLLDDDCTFSSAETPEALSEENYLQDDVESDPLLFGEASTLQALSKFPLRIKQEPGHFEGVEPWGREVSEPATAPAPLKSAQAPSAGAKAGSNRSRSSLNGKSQSMCSYSNCPLPYQSNKWRTVTAETGAGGQDWTPLMGKLLCDSCYSTYRKHGTLVRSVRTSEGWSRIDVDGTCRPNTTQHAAKKRQRAECASGEHVKARRIAAEAARASALQAMAAASSLDSAAGRPCREKRPSIRLREIMEENPSIASGSPIAPAAVV